MTETELADLIAKGTTRYAGEWHLRSCADATQAMACTVECTEARTTLKNNGIVVDCPDGMSWPDFTNKLTLLGANNG